MALTRERWQSLVVRLIQEEREQPVLYRLRIVLLASLAYFYLLAILVSAVGLAWTLVSLFGFLITHFASFMVVRVLLPILFAVGSFVLVLLGAMWVYIPSPRGIEINATDAAPLIIEIERLRQELKVGRIHHILLNDDFNAGVKQVPRLGVFGWTQNYLILGIPLMASLSPEQFRAIIAHELSHISGGHGRFSSWVYQLNVAWFQILVALEHEDSASVILFEAFFHWFAPLFAAYTFPVRRKHEYEADFSAARLVTAETMGSALIASNLAARAIAEGRNGTLDRKTAQRWLNDVSTERINFTEVHPSLCERLRALQQKPMVPEPIQEMALTRFLGYKAQRLAEQAGIQIVFVAEETAGTPHEDRIPAILVAEEPKLTEPPYSSNDKTMPIPMDWLRPIGQ
jgi:Zn-dependent protease with chaperone function